MSRMPNNSELSLIMIDNKNVIVRLTCYGSILFLCVSLFYHLGCALPKQDRTGAERSTASPNISFVPSIRTRETPPILGVRYVHTIGRTGQGAGEFLMPMGIALDAYGQLYVADAGNNRIQVIDTNGNFITEFGSHGWREGEFDYPNDIALSLNTLYVADTGNNRVQYCNLVNTIFYTITATSQEVQFDAPAGIAIGRNDEVFIVDTHNHRWLQFSRNFTPIFSMGSFGSSQEHFWNPTDLVVDPHGTVYVVDTGNHCIKRYDFSGNAIQTWGKEGSELGQFHEPKRITLDNWSYLYVTDNRNRRIQIFTPEGEAVIEFTHKTILNPCGIAVSNTGYVYVSDTDAGNIKVFHVIFKTESPSPLN